MNISAIIGIIITGVYSCFAAAQGYETDSTAGGSTKKSIISASADKIANVFVFNGKADLFISSKYGDIALFQNYKGNTLRTYTNTYVDNVPASVLFNALREDESLGINYSLPLGSNISLLLNQRLLVSSDNVSSGINDLSRLNGQAGLSYKSGKSIYLSILGGAESNKSLGIETSGGIYNLSGFARNIGILDINTNTFIEGEITDYRDGRKYIDISINADAVKIYDDNANIGLSINFKKQDRDLLVPRYITPGTYPIERRFEDRLGADFRIGFMFFDNLTSGFNATISNHSVDRQYSQFIENVDLSFIGRNLNEFRMSFSGSLDFRIDNIRQTVSLSFDSRDEKNKVHNLFGLDDTKSQALRNQEFQRDNITTITRLNTATKWNTHTKDTLSVDYSMSIIRYDTPSRDNYDERDQFNMFLSAAYSMDFSENFGAIVTAELTMNHLVNLKSKLSAGNYWNRVIRLSPEFRIRSKYFIMSPVFEILANYTVYDYEVTSAGIRSYSLRQVSYKDSVFVPISSGYSLQAGIKLKYYENGQLLWKTFSESPQRSNFEKFGKLMIIRNIDEFNFFGCGLRYYNFESAGIGTANTLSSYAANPVTSYGLEAVVNYSLFNNSKISLQGWYEFQKVSNKGFKSFPNFFILTVINL